MQAITGLDGAYALLGIRPGTDELLLGVDYFGLQPLYYVRHAGAIWCTTALRGLAMLPDLPTGIDRAHLIRKNLRIGRVYTDAQLLGITRIRANSLHQLPLEGVPNIVHGEPIQPVAERKCTRSDHDLVAALNTRVLQRVNQIPGNQPLALWLSGGLDSRWISAALHRSGRTHDLLIVGPEGDEDRALALQYGEAHRRRMLVGDPTDLESALRLPEINWHLDASASLFEQMVGGLWPTLVTESPRLLHGYFWDLLKSTPPMLPRSLGDLRPDRLPFQNAPDPMSQLLQITNRFLDQSRLAVLAPDAPELLCEAVQSLAPRLCTDDPPQVVLRLSIDGGPLEPFLTWGRMGSVLGGNEFPLADTELASLILETMTLPKARRESLQARCVLALDPEVAGRIPVHPLNIRPDVLARGGPLRSGHVIRNPAWLPGRILQRSRMHRAPSRMQVLGSPFFRKWLDDLLQPGSAAATAFGHQNIANFAAAALAPPFSWRAISILYELAAMELFVQCFRRAQSGSRRPWVGLEPPIQ